MSFSGTKMESYGGGQSSSNLEETTQRYELKRRDPELPTRKRLKKNKKKKRRVIEELAECTRDNKEKDELEVFREQDVLTTSLDSTNYNGLDCESVIKYMEEEVNIALNTMVQLLGVKKEVALLQYELLQKSLHIRNDYILLVLKALEKEYVYEQEEREVLKKIWDVEMKHMQLIRDEHIYLVKIGTDKGNKKQKMAEKAEEEENNFDGKQLVLSIEELQEIQDKLEKINEEARDEVLRIAQNYSKIRKPAYEKRNNIIKDIPNFWLTAFLRHPVLAELISTKDQEVLKFLSSLEVEHSTDVKFGYTITFYFNQNPHFRNTLLSKTYTFLEEGRPTKVTASTIQWLEGNGAVSPLDEDSFFRWFSSEVNQKDDEIAAIIKDELWENPLTFFNEADEEKDLHEAEDEVVKDIEDDAGEEADDADEEDRDAADDAGGEIVKDTEDDDEEADEEDLEGKDSKGSHDSESSQDDYDLGGMKPH
ncbi:uncharacterized protein LOC132624818 [Lycium barbarum]|uniref:uncharacterized protein LOC132624818 n=1 Tax=Lycium barbarum TaxID=112863 RepID=UPI00293F3DC7|nr:uncharacterized protein LOC132624818 [Lycium barbarum]XP_060195523.1 uncharacterized protein LOC132624818 [Lycium barbarum]